MELKQKGLQNKPRLDGMETICLPTLNRIGNREREKQGRVQGKKGKLQSVWVPLQLLYNDSNDDKYSMIMILKLTRSVAFAGVMTKYAP